MKERTPRFKRGDTVNLKDGRHRIPATVVQSYDSHQGKWHGFTYDLNLHGGNEGQKAEGVRESKIENRLCDLCGNDAHRSGVRCPVIAC